MFFAITCCVWLQISSSSPRRARHVIKQIGKSFSLTFLDSVLICLYSSLSNVVYYERFPPCHLKYKILILIVDRFLKQQEISILCLPLVFPLDREILLCLLCSRCKPWLYSDEDPPRIRQCHENFSGYFSPRTI